MYRLTSNQIRLVIIENILSDFQLIVHRLTSNHYETNYGMRKISFLLYIFNETFTISIAVKIFHNQKFFKLWKIHAQLFKPGISWNWQIYWWFYKAQSNWTHSFVDGKIFFKCGWVFKLKTLTLPSGVRFLIYH